jgi:hypothetical protein
MLNPSPKTELVAKTIDKTTSQVEKKSIQSKKSYEFEKNIINLKSQGRFNSGERAKVIQSYPAFVNSGFVYFQFCQPKVK